MQLRAAVLLIGLSLAPNVNADLEVVQFRETFVDKTSSFVALTIRLNGQISKSDVTALTTLLQLAEHSENPKNRRVVALFTELNSVGGDVASALELGRLLRKNGALAVVDHDSHCASACVFVLAGAPRRHVEGAVLIHRPYDPNDTLSSAAEQKSKYSALRTIVAAYLEEMNVSAQLYEDMLRTSPEKAQLLSENDLLRYGLSVNDPYEEEASATQRAKELRISREEYARRTVRAKQICKIPGERPETVDDPIAKKWKEWMKCEDDVMDGRK